MHPLSRKSSLQRTSRTSQLLPQLGVQDSACYCVDASGFMSPASDGGQPVQAYTIHGEEELCEDGRRSTFVKFGA